MDHYNILGVPATATHEQIKSAYRSLAKLYHPDRPDGDVEKFKKINEAYEVLKDPQKRYEYDNPQPQFNARSNSFGMEGEFEDIFSHLFGQNFQRRRAPKNQDVHLSAELELSDVFVGKTLYATYNLKTGKQERVEIKVPPGIANGQKMCYKNLGDDSNKAIPRGDLYVTVRIKKDRTWIVEGINLYSTVSVNVIDLILGTELSIITPEKKTIKLKIPKGTNPETTFSINGYGIPDYKRGKRGSLYIKVKGLVPNIDDENLLKTLEEINNGFNTST